MFLSREEKEQQKQRQELIDKLSKKLAILGAEYNSELEEYTRSISPKWEYKQISSKDSNIFKTIKELGRAGWEMVGVTSFSEGATIAGAGGYSVYTLYVFKRQLPKTPKEIAEKYMLLQEIRGKIEILKSG